MHIKDAAASKHFSHGDAEILLAYICGKPRTWLLAHLEYVLTPAQEHQWDTFRKRREQGEPVAYITGEKEFFGRSFHIDHSVLIPRPSTEGLVEIVLALIHEKPQAPGPPPPPRLRRAGRPQAQILDTGIIGICETWGQLSDIDTIVDVGTGSGCIAITLACELPDIHIIALDISVIALDIARKNAKRHGVWERIQFLQGNLLEPLQTFQNPFLLVSNPPYIPEEEKLPLDVSAYEPSVALHAGPDGLAILRPLLAAASTHPACRGYVIECREDQENALRKQKFDEKTTEGKNARL